MRKVPLFSISSFIVLFRYGIFISFISVISLNLSGCFPEKQKHDQAAKDSISPSQVPDPDWYVKQGSLYFKRGAFEKAVANWETAAGLYEKESDPEKQVEALIKLSQAYQLIGQLGDALNRLTKALDLARTSGDSSRLAMVYGYLGNIYISLGEFDKADSYLKKGLTRARESGNLEVVATVLNNLGNLYTSQKRYDEAVSAYKESMTLSKESGNHSMAAIAGVNGGMALIRDGAYGDAEHLFDRALNMIQGLEATYYKAYGLISTGLGYRELGVHLPDQHARFLSKAYETLSQSLVIATAIEDYRTVSYALGYLGSLYEKEKRYQEALNLTRRAVFAAQKVNAPESLYRWQWQTGRLLNTLGKREEAISAYKGAVYSLQLIRQEMSECYANTESSFRKVAGSVCFELVDLLLRQAATFQDPEKYTPYLIDAREAVELLKVFELRDYFRDDCVDALRYSTLKLDKISKTAVVVYPILLKDRIEILATLPTGLKRYSVPVGVDNVRKEVIAFRRKLEKRTTWEFLPHAQKIYKWLISPFESELEILKVDTLVFVPDGPLRMIPISTLHDGKDFLIRKYAIAVTPGLDLTDPRPIEREGVNILALGLTEPVQGFGALPYVPVELEAIDRVFTCTKLLDQDFSIVNMEEALRNKKYNIVHIASHGEFGGDVNDTFLVAFDDRVTMDHLRNLIGLFKFRDEPLDLLTLSACETAVGDERAALGLAGIAIKAGARSALATLWHINDPASSHLISEFYTELKDPAISRALALRRAQLKLMKDSWYKHPGYWSPFLLINNWL